MNECTTTALHGAPYHPCLRWSINPLISPNAIERQSRFGDECLKVTACDNGA